jgi:hypothetical protein
MSITDPHPETLALAGSCRSASASGHAPEIEALSMPEQDLIGSWIAKSF